jgi:TetR/AcrR family transcriptional regulator, ethionamide resistance regulator
VEAKIPAVSIPPTGPRLDTSGPDTRRESIERRILEGAQSLIDAGASWHQIGIRQITERAEISRTAFYDFFSSKNEVLEHLIRGLHEDLTFNLREVLDPQSRGHFDLAHLRPALSAVGAYAQRHGHAYRAFLDATSEDAHLAELWSELVDVYASLIAASIAAVREADPSAPSHVDPATLGRTLMLMTERCLVADRSGVQAPGTLDGLVYVWEQAVFGASPAPSSR